MRSRQGKQAVRIVTALAAVTLVAGTGAVVASAASTTTPGGDAPCAGTTDNSAATDGSADDVVAAGQGAAGPECDLPDITVGYLQWVYADEAGKRIEDAAKAAVDWAGWGFETCDAGGDPAKMPVCGNQLLDMGVDVIMTDGIPESFITDVLERAKSEGVPVISGGGEVEPRDFYIASFASDDTDLGVQLANWLTEQLPDGGDIITQTFPADWSVNRINGLNSVIEGSNINVVDTWEADPTNMVDGTNADVTSKLQQYPDVKAVWINFSVASIGAAQAIGAMPEDGPAAARHVLRQPGHRRRHQRRARRRRGRGGAGVAELGRRRCADAARRPWPAAEPGAGAHLQRRQLLGAPGDRRDQRPGRRHAGRLAGRLRVVLPVQVVHGVHQPAQLRVDSLELVALGVVIGAARCGTGP